MATGCFILTETNDKWCCCSRNVVLSISIRYSLKTFTAHMPLLTATSTFGLGRIWVLISDVTCSVSTSNYLLQLEMWANAQRDGHPAECRWRPLFNAAKFGWRPLLECRAVTLPRHETGWNLQACPKLANRSQQLVGWSLPYYQDMWGRYCV